MRQSWSSPASSTPGRFPRTARVDARPRACAGETKRAHSQCDPFRAVRKAPDGVLRGDPQIPERVAETRQQAFTEEDMIMLRLSATAACLIALAASALAHGPNQPPHQLYKVGDLTLESGEVIKDFSFSYVTHGTLNAKKSNAILMVTAISGNHHRLDFLIGPARRSTPTSTSSSVPTRSATGSPPRRRTRPRSPT